jgi:23S rRNA pseudouridine2605 synthase
MLLEGIKLEDGIAKFRSVQRVAGGEGANQWFNVSLTEGRTREVRRLWQSFEHLMVSRLVRTQYGMVDLPRDVAARRWRYLPFRLANALAKSVGLEASKEGEDERKGTQSDDGRKKTRQNKGHRRR